VAVRDLPPVTSPSSAGRFQAFDAGGLIGELVRSGWSEARENAVAKGI